LTPISCATDHVSMLRVKVLCYVPLATWQPRSPSPHITIRWGEELLEILWMYVCLKHEDPLMPLGLPKPQNGQQDHGSEQNGTDGNVLVSSSSHNVWVNRRGLPRTILCRKETQPCFYFWFYHHSFNSNVLTHAGAVSD
jgi:hypothetical protein